MRCWVACGGAALLVACASAPVNLSAPAVLALPTPAVAAPAVHSAADVFVEAATSMLDEPYRYGGSAPGGFDCSGLVAYAAARAGFDVPRTAREQMRAGSRIERRDVRGGDLVFMRLRSKELHVGIAIDGEHFVHAPSAGRRVRIDAIDEAPYSLAFLEARRVAGNGAAYSIK